MTETSLDPGALSSLYDRAEKLAGRSGCAVQIAVARNGTLEGHRTFGRARHGDGSERDADDRTLFCVYSVTKAITSAAVWILLQERKLLLDDAVVGHIPEFGAHGKDVVTIEQLLTHTAGFPSALLRTRLWADPQARALEMAGWKLEWEPGSRFVYHGSSSMWVLAELITRAAGMDYRDFVRKRILEPLGLKDLFLGLPEGENPRVADVVIVGDAPDAAGRAGSPVDAPVVTEQMLGHANDPANRAISSPAGGGIATAADVALFYQALLADAQGRGKGIWQPTMLREALRPRNLELIDPMTKQPALRGLGVVVAGEQGRMWRGFAEGCSPSCFGHMGAGGQVSWADPESGLSFVFLTSGAERDAMRQGANGFRLSSLAVACLPGAEERSAMVGRP